MNSNFKKSSYICQERSEVGKASCHFLSFYSHEKGWFPLIRTVKKIKKLYVHKSIMT